MSYFDSQSQPVYSQSQNMVIGKRPLSSRRSRYSRRAQGYSRYSTRVPRPLTNKVRRTWPYAGLRNAQSFDPFPKKHTALLRYTDTISLDPTAGVPASWLFRAGSINDPDFSGVGHQPYGHDTYQAIYNHYLVKSSVITVTPTQTTNGIFGITLTDDASVSGGFSGVREPKDTKMAVMTASSPVSTIVNKYNINSNFDIARQASCVASFGSNPTEDMNFHLWYEGPSAADNPPSLSFLVTISYIVEMFELKDLGSS